MKKTDVVLIFPPQWSPFQPPLSLPSLHSWLKMKNLIPKSFDLNIDFYWWLLSEECSSLLLSTLDSTELSDQTKSAYRIIFSNSKKIKSDVENLCDVTCPEQNIHLLQNHFILIKSLDLYLRAISDVEESFSISPYGFTLSRDYLNAENLEDFVKNPPAILRSFIDTEVDKLLSSYSTLSIGISCIGQEQLAFTMLIGKRIKELSKLPVVVGGTILPRIYNRGSLPSTWFGRYFDFIVVNEGEKPLEQLLCYLKNNKSGLYDIEGIIYSKSAFKKVQSTKPSNPLDPSEIPIPDFDDMPLSRYMSPEITLPLLSSRGCYWGKCAFCHHGMVYGGKHSTYDITAILKTLKLYSEKYGVNCFAFNDEAIPPKILRSMGEVFPDCESSGWSFTGLIKFEVYLKQADFANASRIGFKSLYVGLESASDSVLKLMNKKNSKETMVRNLSDATKAGILMHCFVFFGFPGEKEEDAEQTYKFLLTHQDIVGSIGCGVFSLEHDAPIFYSLEAFGVILSPIDKSTLDVYYKYNVKKGITHEKAKAWEKKLNNALFNNPKYASTNWIPREHLLSILKYHDIQKITEWGKELIRWRNIPRSMRIGQLVLSSSDNDSIILVNRLNRKSLHITGYTAKALNLMLDKNISVSELRNFSEEIFNHISSSKSVLPEFATTSKET